MVKAFRISLELRNAYRVNTVLYYIKQLPLIGKHLPESLYQQRWIKILAQLLAVMWELMTALSGKAVFLGLMVFLPASLFESTDPGSVFLHIFLLLSLVGTKLNDYLLDADESSFYAVSLLGMDARQYMLANWGYRMGKLLVGYLIFGMVFGLLSGVSVWLCLLMPLFAMGAKCSVTAGMLRRYDRKGTVDFGAVGEKVLVVVLGGLFGAAYFLPLLEVAMPQWVSGSLMAVCILSGALSVKKLVSYADYRVLHQYLYQRGNALVTEISAEPVQASRKNISDAAGITSQRRGFAYFNELFVKRHRKILWKPAIQTAIAAAVMIVLLGGAFVFVPELRQELELDLMQALPMFAFIMYAVNRGTVYTQTLFMNCDHSLLTYSFYKQPKMILKLFRIRLLQIVKVNLLPGTVIASGLPVLLYLSGGTDDPLNYAVMFVSIISMNIFFSVHYLTIYYLLQPYNAGSELKNGAYQFVTALTYFVCYMLIQAEIPAVLFGICAIGFCGLYCVVACLLVYFLAPKTFKIRN